MAKVRYVGDRPVLVPELGDRLVQPDEIHTVPDDRFEAYMLHPDRWESVEEPPDTEPVRSRKTKTTAPAGTTAKAARTPEGGES